MSNAIDITGLDKAEVLAALFNASEQQGMGLLQIAGVLPMTVEDAKGCIADGDLDWDYLHGRVMKVDLSEDILRVGLYDRDNGQGAAAKALEPLLLIRDSCDKENANGTT